MGQITGKELAIIYVLRASTYRAMQQYDLAIADLNHAIDLLSVTATKDVVASAYVTRGSVYSLTGATTKALADYQQAAALDATNPQAADGVKTLQAELASTTARPAGNSGSAELSAPQEPIPAEISISTDVLQLVQSHPFFAQAPAIRVGRFNLASSISTSTSAGPGATITAYTEEDLVTWLRAGIARIEQDTDMATTSSGRTEPGSGQTEQILAADGFIPLGSRGTSGTRFGKSVTKEKTLRVDNLSGHIFPLELGNRFSYERVSEQNTTMAGQHFRYQNSFTQSCSVSNRYDGSAFHSDLTGYAYIVDCNNRMMTETATTNSPSRSIFFEELGFWISADPVALREQIVSNGTISNGVISKTGMKFTFSTTGTHILKSFSTVR
jgi:tetratricopeptide (TPR) repeat protein